MKLVAVVCEALAGVHVREGPPNPLGFVPCVLPWARLELDQVIDVSLAVGKVVKNPFRLVVQKLAFFDLGSRMRVKECLSFNKLQAQQLLDDF